MAKKDTTTPTPAAKAAEPSLPEPNMEAAVAAFAHFLYRDGDTTDELVKGAARRALRAGSLFAAVLTERAT